MAKKVWCYTLALDGIYGIFDIGSDDAVQVPKIHHLYECEPDNRDLGNTPDKKLYYLEGFPIDVYKLQEAIRNYDGENSPYVERAILTFASDTRIEFPTLTIDASKDFFIKIGFRADNNIEDHDIIATNSTIKLRARTELDWRVIVGGTGINAGQAKWTVGNYDTLSVDYTSSLTTPTINVSTDSGSSSDLATGTGTNTAGVTLGGDLEWVGAIYDFEVYDENDLLIHRYAIDENCEDGGTIIDSVGGADGILTLGGGSWDQVQLVDPTIEITEVFNGSCEYYDVGLCTALSQFSVPADINMKYLWTVSEGGLIIGDDDSNTLQVASINNNAETDLTVYCTMTTPSNISTDLSLDFTQYRTVSPTPTKTQLLFNQNTNIIFNAEINLAQTGKLQYIVRISEAALDISDRMDVWGTVDNQNYTRLQPNGFRIARGGQQVTFTSMGFNWGDPFLITEAWNNETNELTLTCLNLKLGGEVTKTGTMAKPQINNTLYFGDRMTAYMGIMGVLAAFEWSDETDTPIHRWDLDEVIEDGGTVPDAIGDFDGILNLGDGLWIEENIPPAP